MTNPAGYGSFGHTVEPTPASRPPFTGSRKLIWINVVLTLLITVALIFSGIQLLDLMSLRASSRTPDTAAGQRIRDRVGDPERLRDSELFEARSFTIDSRSYTVSDIAEATPCRQATHGDRVPRALEAYDCNQVLRATLLDKSEQFATTWGVVNLADAPGAAALESLLNRPNVYGGFTLLQTPRIDAKLKTRKTAIAHRRTGHYVVFVIVIKLDVLDYDTNDAAIAQIVNDGISHLDKVVTDHASDA